MLRFEESLESEHISFSLFGPKEKQIDKERKRISKNAKVFFSPEHITIDLSKYKSIAD